MRVSFSERITKLDARGAKPSGGFADVIGAAGFAVVAVIRPQVRVDVTAALGDSSKVVAGARFHISNISPGAATADPLIW